MSRRRRIFRRTRGVKFPGFFRRRRAGDKRFGWKMSRQFEISEYARKDKVKLNSGILKGVSAVVDTPMLAR
jgi:hypothetical protein